MLPRHVSLDDLFYRSVQRLRQSIALGALFSVVLVPIFAFLGEWSDGLTYGVIPVVMLGAIAGAQEVSASRRRRRLRLLSRTTLSTGFFASAWACFWLIPFNLLILLRHGHAMTLNENFKGILVVGFGAFLLSLLPSDG